MGKNGTEYGMPVKMFTIKSKDQYISPQLKQSGIQSKLIWVCNIQSIKSKIDHLHHCVLEKNTDILSSNHGYMIKQVYNA